MMWILVQTNEKKTRYKYLASHDYNVIISYINRFSNVKKYNDYLFVTRDDIYFEIKLGEDLDYNEKTSKEKEYNKEVIYENRYTKIRKRD